MLKKLLVFKLLCLVSAAATAETIPVKNMEELNAANKKAQPGDIVVLKNGEWSNVTIKLTCTGTHDKPIIFKAETTGKVLITGLSKLKLAGNYITVDGLYFVNGYAGDDAVISFRADSKQLANNCRVTNCAVNDFNNPKRMDDNNWVLFYGKKNELDHCSFIDKKNMGVLLAVILDDERSRENNHHIHHNYFGRRPPLGSNGGEIIRVGVSQHAQFNSGTQIANNFFEHCDGETEIISIKSCNNTVQQNVFKECQGSVVLRHGDDNLVAGNYFLGNDKTATGGVRVINKGQAVISNIFYKCRGTDFRSPLAIMNGIPNSPAHRYVQVTEAEIVDNTFYECAPLAFCEGSDAERTLPPDGVRFTDNTFYNTRDSIIYRVFDDMNGFAFANNRVSRNVRQTLPNGFVKQIIPPAKWATKGPDRPHVDNILTVEKLTRTNAGARWFAGGEKKLVSKPIAVKCVTADDIYRQLERKEPVTIQLTSTNYILTKPLVITKQVHFTALPKSETRFFTGELSTVFQLEGNAHLTLERLDIIGSAVNAKHFISTDTTGYSNHYNIVVRFCRFANFGIDSKCENIFYAHKSMIADSTVFRSSTFHRNKANAIVMSAEKDDKGYYNAEKIIIDGNSFAEQSGTLLNIYRGGNDESTLGPNLSVQNNSFIDCENEAGPLISLTGVQVSNIISNKIMSCNSGKILIAYKDIVRARHLFSKNTIIKSGTIEGNVFLTEKNNIKN